MREIFLIEFWKWEVNDRGNWYLYPEIFRSAVEAKNKARQLGLMYYVAIKIQAKSHRKPENE